MSRRFRVAFSYAGEKRPFVSKVARILAKRFGEKHILYDKYHEAEFARSDLAFHLAKLYRQNTELIVVVLCRNYEKKEWCGLEWNAIYGIIKERKENGVMLCRFDQAEGKGLHGLAGFLDLDRKTPDQVATLIMDRLAINKSPSKECNTDVTQTEVNWPLDAPSIDWPVANHYDAQSAFGDLLTQDAPFRLLLISGISDTGKSHLTKQFLYNGLRMSGLACARLDFKGSLDIDGELRAFSERLEVSPPASNAGVTRQLGHILLSLKENQKATLLIFDTFEQAGDAWRWTQENLLPSLVRAPWLRVIIVGQRVPAKHGEIWAELSLSLQLSPPKPREWYIFAKRHKPKVTLNFVRQAHKFSDGRGTILAQLLGPKV